MRLFQIQELSRNCVSSDAAKLASLANVVKTWMYQVPEPLYDCVQLDTHADNE